MVIFATAYMEMAGRCQRAQSITHQASASLLGALPTVACEAAATPASPRRFSVGGQLTQQSRV